MNQVLVVEDSQAESQRIKLFLEKKGFSVQGVTSGEEAELRLKVRKPALIVLDVILPGKSGFELCRQLKTDPENKSIPIIIYSIKDREIDKNWANMSGADACVSKSVDENTFLKIVDQLIHR